MAFNATANNTNRLHGLSLGLGAITIVCQGMNLAICYWLINNKLGTEFLGIWALIQAVLVFGRVVEFGLAQSLIHFLPQALKNKDLNLAQSYFDTVFVLSIILYVSLAILFYIPAETYIKGQIDPQYQIEFVNTFLYAVIAFAIINIGQTGINALIGLQKAYQGHLILITAYFMNTVVVIYTIDHSGLASLAFGNLVTGLTILFLGNLLVGKNLNIIPFFPVTFKTQNIKSVFNISVKLQFIVLLSALVQITILTTINNLFGLQTIAIYEMANRFVIFIKNIFVVPQNYLGSFFGSLNQSDPNILKLSMNKALQVSSSLSIIFLAVIAITHIWVGEIWIGKENTDFEKITMLLIIGWFFNIMASPFYYAYLGLGKLSVPLISQFINASLVFVLCYIFGNYFDLTGLIISISASLAVAQIYLFVKGMSFANQSINHFFLKRMIFLIMTILIFYFFVIYIDLKIIQNFSLFEKFITFGIIMIVYLTIHLKIDRSLIGIIKVKKLKI